MLFTILSPVVVGKIYHTFDVTLKLWQIWIWMWNICDRPMGPLVPGMSRDNHHKKVKIHLRCPWWGKKRMLKQASVILEKWNCLRLNVKLKVKIGFIHLDTKEGGRFPKSCCSDCKNKKSIEGCIHILPTRLAVLHIYQILKVRMRQYMPIWLIFCRSVLLSHIGLVSQRISPVDPFRSLRTRIRIKAWQNIAR